MSRHRAQEQMLARAQARNPYVPAPWIGDAAGALSRKQLEAADVLATDDRDWLPGIDRNDEGRREVRSEVDLAARERKCGWNSGIGRHVADVGEAFRPQELVGDILGRDANAGDF